MTLGVSVRSLQYGWRFRRARWAHWRTLKKLLRVQKSLAELPENWERGLRAANAQNIVMKERFRRGVAMGLARRAQALGPLQKMMAIGAGLVGFSLVGVVSFGLFRLVLGPAGALFALALSIGCGLLAAAFVPLALMHGGWLEKGGIRDT